MIDYIDRQLDGWGNWSRDSPGIGYGKSPIARIIRSSVEQNQPPVKLSVMLNDDEAMRVDLAVRKLDREMHSLCVAWYLWLTPMPMLEQRIHKSKRTIYRMLDNLHERVAVLLSDDD